jgi:hypothetical protein
MHRWIFAYLFAAELASAQPIFRSIYDTRHLSERHGIHGYFICEVSADKIVLQRTPFDLTYTQRINIDIDTETLAKIYADLNLLAAAPATYSEIPVPERVNISETAWLEDGRRLLLSSTDADGFRGIDHPRYKAMILLLRDMCNRTR